MAQSTITSYFSNRKRAATDDFKMKSKVLVLDQSAVPLGYDANSTDNSPARPVTRKVVVARSKPVNTHGHESKPSTRGTASRANKNQSAKQPDLTNFFKKPEKSEETPKETEACTKPTVLFEMRGPLSPVKKRQQPAPVPAKSEEPQVAPTQEAQPKESAVEKARKELSLGDIKSRVTSRPSRLAELKERIARIERGEARLKELEKQASSESSSSSPVRPDASPRLNKFHTIEIEVPASPTKSPLTSPSKLLSSPRHPGLASPSKSPAFQRFAHLTATTEKVALPYGYRILAELFRCVDWSVSMMHNRTETVTFAKLKPCVQEMCRKTFTERHLAQIKTVLPNAFATTQIKMRNFGSMAKEKYELVILPLIKSDTGPLPAAPGQMTPALLAERQQDFYKSLVEIVKEHHDEYLRSLEPPLVVDKAKVTRWHALFPLDGVPEVTPAELPVAPGQEKVSSAKDVLAHARHLFTVNPRMGKALEKVAAAGEGGGATTVKVEVVDADSTSPATPPPAPAAPAKPNIASALKGLPKALLEKIRAKQAAKALEAMTRSPAQDKEAVQYSRLPEIARILRNCYVVEKKGVMPLEIVVEKVANSYRTTISGGELEEHLRLMAKEVPGWITFDTIRNADFLRLSKSADMNKVLKKLESLAAQKTGISA